MPTAARRKWYCARSLRVRIDERMPLAQAAQAHQMLGRRETRGKLLLEVGHRARAH